MMWKKLLAITSLLALSACSITTSPQEEASDFPLYFDPNYALQIYRADTQEPFPFAPNSLVRIRGIMVYHGPGEWVAPGALADVQWGASVYPDGTFLGDELLSFEIESATDAANSYQFNGFADNDSQLLVVSDQPPPAALFPAAEIGNTASICLTLRVGSFENDPEQTTIVLLPHGEMVSGLILANVQACDS